MKYKIAIVNPTRRDGLFSTVLDGLQELKKSHDIDIRLSQEFLYFPELSKYILSREHFIDYAKEADLIFVGWGQEGINYKLLKTINRWDRSIFFDGSEVGKNRRFD